MKAKKSLEGDVFMMSSTEPSEHEIWDEEAESSDGVGEFRSQRPVEKRAEYWTSSATQSTQGTEHSSHNALSKEDQT